MNAVVKPAPIPLWMVAELTYRCPLHCAFCSNPVDFAKVENELSTEEWFRVFARGARAGRGAAGPYRRGAAAAARTWNSWSPRHIGSGSTPT